MSCITFFGNKQIPCLYNTYCNLLIANVLFYYIPNGKNTVFLFAALVYKTKRSEFLGDYKD
jgi:hypothetical protein